MDRDSRYGCVERPAAGDGVKVMEMRKLRRWPVKCPGKTIGKFPKIT